MLVLYINFPYEKLYSKSFIFKSNTPNPCTYQCEKEESTIKNASIVNDELEEMKERYLWKGLDLQRYDVVEILPQFGKHAVIIMKCKEREDIKPWCVQYMQSGHYFATREELDEYMATRKWIRN